MAEDEAFFFTQGGTFKASLLIGERFSREVYVWSIYLKIALNKKGLRERKNQQQVTRRCFLLRSAIAG
jgi:hypothetical protein